MEEDAEGDALGVELAVELVLLLPQAATPAPSAQASSICGTDQRAFISDIPAFADRSARWARTGATRQRRCRCGVFREKISPLQDLLFRRQESVAGLEDKVSRLNKWVRALRGL
jgi:hypothetical protein